MTILTNGELESKPRVQAAARLAAEPRKARWAFGRSALPSDPLAREHEKRGRKWLVVSYFLCPCHVPIALAILGAVFGGSTLGAAATGNGLAIGIILTAAYGFALWRGFRQIRRAKRIEAAGGTLKCTPDGCAVTQPQEG